MTACTARVSRPHPGRTPAVPSASVAALAVVGVVLQLALLAATSAASVASPTWLLPDTSGIDGQLTETLNVDRFFGLWLVFNDETLSLSDKPFTILAPVNSAEPPQAEPGAMRRLLLDHVVLGKQLDLDIGADLRFATLGGHTVKVQNHNGTLTANGARVLKARVEVPRGILVTLDNYLFTPPSEEGSTSSSTTPGPPSLEAAATATTAPKANASTATPAAAAAAATTADADTVPPALPTAAAHVAPAEPKPLSGFLRDVTEVLSFLKSGTRVFQHLLSRAQHNVSRMLADDGQYTLLVPTDLAFQRWHPIDWGFYPFSVAEFSESVVVNHFLKSDLRADDLKDGQVALSLEGREVVFARKPNLTVNGVQVVGGDTPVAHGNILLINEVLFVTEEVVARLHENNRDKETPPLLAFPWIGAQFLSHAFLALEEAGKGFVHATRFLNMADLAPHVPGTGYTFFVPTDEAFERLGLGSADDSYLATGAGLDLLLNHFVAKRLYARDLQNGSSFTTLGNKTVAVSRKHGSIFINNARVVKSEVFVYNLGTMFYIDHVLFGEDGLPPRDHQGSSSAGPFHVTTEIPDEVETIPVELNLESADKNIQDDDPDREPTTSGPDSAPKTVEDP
ncbi:Transforming growth factor-beta-induced protein ig-h3 [Frankliniella fusca]|uniref:Transforming growth factor-beta-induced protein ig-h3 n=1 Tax=Frankliniella fusca TaxID=407009 RepID=A0AAE1LBL8_9NEOP|nr:Transforming growth factor-beta-induced protein ig-h3 [Frankliniella fusca]